MSMDARTMWLLVEPVHAVVYFAPEVTAAYKEAGLKGFWMGYFAGRAAPFGEASAELVGATFFNFAPRMVQRAIPDAWSFASPDAVDAARTQGVDAALRGMGVDALDVAEALSLLEEAVDGCRVDGRPLYAAWRARPWPDQPHLRLWHAATLLREHRGDGHVAANLGAGFTGLHAHLAMVGSGKAARDTIQPNRGWTDEEWDAAAADLRGRGLLAGDGTLADEGRAARDQVEAATDRLAMEPWDHLGPEKTARVAELLTPVRAAVAASGIVPFPNPMGLPQNS
jgi:hypothetical protein